jgi:hypothetical protein
VLWWLILSVLTDIRLCRFIGILSYLHYNYYFARLFLRTCTAHTYIRSRFYRAYRPVRGGRQADIIYLLSCRVVPAHPGAAGSRPYPPVRVARQATYIPDILQGCSRTPWYRKSRPYLPVRGGRQAVIIYLIFCRVVPAHPGTAGQGRITH